MIQVLREVPFLSSDVDVQREASTLIDSIESLNVKSLT